MANEYHKNGLKHCNIMCFYRNGNMQGINFYKEGKEICKSYFFNNNGKLRRINFYDDEGKFIFSQKKAR